MCCGGKCLFFINIRTGSLIFGYITAIICGAGTIICAGFAMYFGICLMFPSSYENQTYYFDEQHSLSTTVSRPAVADQVRYTSTIIIITLYFIEFLSGFICSVLLLVGITKNKASFVKTFIIYGMIQVVILMTFFIMMHCATTFFSSGYVLLAAGILGLYSLCVCMVFLTYQPMSQQNVFENPPLNTVMQHLMDREINSS